VSRALKVGILLVVLAWTGLLGPLFRSRPALAQDQAASCPKEMVAVRGFCIDRWEVSLVDDSSGEGLSPYYPPEPRLLRAARDYWLIARLEVGDESARRMPLPELPARQQGTGFSPRAVSAPGVVPQAYMSQLLARRACERAGKRLCTKDEWLTACRGEQGTKFPYGPGYVRTRCNVFRTVHPAHLLHGNASIGHRDPRLNLIVESGKDPLLRLTGATAACASRWGSDRIYDMVGNIDEWVDAEGGLFLGGFYARSTTKGCDAEVSAHSQSYFDYSTGARCCRGAK